jgi:hypothetical protein
METTTKQYTKLELPKDSAWDRKTYDPILLLYRTRNIKDKKEWPEWAEKLFDVWFVPKSAVQDFFDFIKRLRIWIPVLWKDRDWDDSYIFGIIKTKLITQRKYLVENYRHTGVPFHNRDITMCLNLIERFQQSHYDIEHFDYYDVDIDFTEVENDKEISEISDQKLYKMNSTTTRDNLLEFIDKYPLDREKTIAWMKEKEIEGFDDYRENEESRKRLAMFMGDHRHQKCKKLIFLILSEKIEGWWD